MSKITEALMRARGGKGAEPLKGSGAFLGYMQAIKSELQEEVHWVEQAVAQKTLSPVMDEAPSGNGAPGASWEGVAALVEPQLLACAYQAAHQTEEQARVQTQVAALEERAAQLERERQVARSRLEQVARTAAALDAAHASLRRAVEAMRAGQRLARAVQAAVAAFEVDGDAATQLIQAKPQGPEDEAARCQQLAATLLRAAQLRSRMEQALLAGGTS